MGRVFTMVLFFTGIMVITQLIGFGLIGVGLANELGFSTLSANNGYDLEASPLWNFIFTNAGAILLVAAGAGIAIGFITKTASENYVILPFITTSMLLFADTIIAILKQSKDFDPWITGILLIIFLPLGAGFIVTMVEWFRGNT